MKNSIKFLPALLLISLLLAGCAGRKDSLSVRAIPLDKALEARVDSVLKMMTLEEKVGQMVQLTASTVCVPGSPELDMAKIETIFGDYKVGSILNTFADTARSREFTASNIRRLQEKSLELIGIPTLYGMDMIHGASYLTDATLFPQEINIAATFNPEHARIMGEVTAYETRAAMIPWIFSPVMDLGRDARWSRHWESWGEDPYLSAVMSEAETRAAQGPDPNCIDLNHVAVSIKHYLAYGVPFTGKDRTPAYVPIQDLREKYFRPFKDCLQAGALTLMVNSASINGIPNHANKELLTGWVKEELGWDGMIVTDWADIANLFVRDHVATDMKEAVALGVNAGIDMIMEPNNPECCVWLKELAEEGRIPMERIDDAVRRVLRLKFRLGLFDHPTWDVSGYDQFGCKEFQDASYRAAVESQVLLKNEGSLLPLEYGTRILVTGPNAHSMRTLNGGWTYTWQGNGDLFAGDCNTIYEAIARKFGERNVIYEPGVTYAPWPDWQAENPPRIDRAVAAAYRAQVIIACVGENSYCETPGNLDDLNLSQNQKDLVKALANTGKPIVLVLNEGRPRIIGDIEPLARAIVDVLLPGNYGGDALAALLSGEENFSGKLPFTYPKHVNALHTYDYKVQEHREMMEGEYNYDAVMDVQWPFGFGLSYTTFEYSDFKVKGSDSFAAGDSLRFEVTVRNTGFGAGKEAVLLYSSDLVASLIPDVKRLRAFTKVSLQPGESRTVSFCVPAHELAFVGADGKWRLEEGAFRMSCGGQSLNLHCTETKVWDQPNLD
ncbi:MAG: glycoside hydrolase family 3 N-terminal domain-containing protein [Bacteroidota bacterium]|nr:glycoside hydrolase family 3 N-terminal domain-containing protein [Bacteroidota bacterium]